MGVQLLRGILFLALFSCGGQATKSTTPPGSGDGDSSSGAENTTKKSKSSRGDEDEKFKNAADAGEFKDDAKGAHKKGHPNSKIKPTATEAAVKFFVEKRETKEPIAGVAIVMVSRSGEKTYFPETNKDGFTEALVSAGEDYDILFLSLGRKNIAAQVKVEDKPHLTVRLTLRYKRWVPELQPKGASEDKPRFTMEGLQFDTGKATIKSSSLPKLDSVIEYMTHKTSAKIEVSGHTDSKGKASSNKRLSERRAEAVRDYLISKGIQASRITAVGYGDAMPIASNDTKEGREKNRRIEVTEM